MLVACSWFSIALRPTRPVITLNHPRHGTQIVTFQSLLRSSCIGQGFLELGAKLKTQIALANDTQDREMFSGKKSEILVYLYPSKWVDGQVNNKNFLADLILSYPVKLRLKN